MLIWFVRRDVKNEKLEQHFHLVRPDCTPMKVMRQIGQFSQ